MDEFETDDETEIVVQQSEQIDQLMALVLDIKQAVTETKHSVKKCELRIGELETNKSEMIGRHNDFLSANVNEFGNHEKMVLDDIVLEGREIENDGIDKSNSGMVYKMPALYAQSDSHIGEIHRSRPKQNVRFYINEPDRQLRRENNSPERMNNRQFSDEILSHNPEYFDGTSGPDRFDRRGYQFNPVDDDNIPVCTDTVGSNSSLRTPHFDSSDNYRSSYSAKPVAANDNTRGALRMDHNRSMQFSDAAIGRNRSTEMGFGDALYDSGQGFNNNARTRSAVIDRDDPFYFSGQSVGGSTHRSTSLHYDQPTYIPDSANDLNSRDVRRRYRDGPMYFPDHTVDRRRLMGMHDNLTLHHLEQASDYNGLNRSLRADRQNSFELPDLTSRNNSDTSGMSQYFAENHIGQVNHPRTREFVNDYARMGSRSPRNVEASEGDSNYRVRPFNAKETDWVTYRNYFDSIASMAHWSDRTKCLKLLGALQGNLTGVTTGMSGIVNYDRLLDRLDSMHGINNDSEDAANQLDFCLKRESETMALYAERIRQLVERAHPYFSMVDKEQQALKAFLRGLSTKHDLRLKMRTAMFSNLRDAVTYGSNLERVSKQEHHAEKNRPVRSASEMLEDDCFESDAEFGKEPVRKAMHELNKKMASIEKKIDVKKDAKDSHNNRDRNDDKDKSDDVRVDHGTNRNFSRNNDFARGQNSDFSRYRNNNYNSGQNRYENRNANAQGDRRNYPMREGQGQYRENRNCFICDSPHHWYKHCPQRATGPKNQPANPNLNW